jgi:hypothetical protein
MATSSEALEDYMQGKLQHFFMSFASGFQDFSVGRQQAAITVIHVPHAVAVMRLPIVTSDCTFHFLKTFGAEAAAGNGPSRPFKDGEHGHVQ